MPPTQIHATSGSTSTRSVADEPSRSNAIRFTYRSASPRLRTAGVAIGCSDVL